MQAFFDCEFLIFVYMQSLIVYPENKEQLTALKAVMKAMKVAFVQQDEVVELPPHVIEGVKKSIAEADSGIGLMPFTSAKDMLDQA